MPRVTRERTVGAPLEAVLPPVPHPLPLPRWWPQVVRVEDASPEAWTKVFQTPRGRTVRADFTRTEIDAPHRLAWRQELDESPFERIFSASLTEIELGAAEGGGTHVALTSQERLRGRFKLGGFMVRRAARRRLDDA